MSAMPEAVAIAVADAAVADAGAVRAKLDAWLRLPSVSTDPAYAEGMQASQRFLLDWLAEIGLDRVQLLDGGGHPAVYGEWLGAPGRPTLLCYGHYDVQPADAPDGWATPPFRPTLRDGWLHARGASDDKGQLFVQLKADHADTSVDVIRKFVYDNVAKYKWPDQVEVVTEFPRTSSGKVRKFLLTTPGQ